MRCFIEVLSTFYNFHYHVIKDIDGKRYVLETVQIQTGIGIEEVVKYIFNR